MSTDKSKDRTTEADLESQIAAVLRQVFPFLPSNSIRHQTQFSFKFGGKTIFIDGTARRTARARADIILYYRSAPLAVLELKRPGVALSDDDVEQGLSYARVLSPPAPLVVVSNGQETRLIETHSGSKWQPSETSQAAFDSLIQRAAKVAGEDLKSAVDTLMGTNPDVWIQAIRQTSEAAIAELTGDWRERALPFVGGFLIPRKATSATKRLIEKGSRLVIVHGPPVVGKSNILRELTLAAVEDTNVVLFIECDSTNIFQQVADLLSSELDWAITKEEARDWLKRISKYSEFRLTLAFEGVGRNLLEIRDQITDLCSSAYGPQLSVVVELDSAIAEQALKDSTGRRLSKVGRKASVVPVLPLDLDEFRSASDMLAIWKIGITHGGQLAPELRLPWVLRAIGSHLVSKEHDDSNIIKGIPPLLSLQLMYLTREAFRGDHELRRKFRLIAIAVVQDALDRGRSISLILESMSVYVVLRSTLEHHISPSELNELVAQGWLRLGFEDSGEARMIPRMPELVASEVAYVLSEELDRKHGEDAKETAAWLTAIAGAIPFGDIAAAQAMIDSAIRKKEVSIDLISALLEKKPRMDKLNPGSKVAMHLPGLGVFEARVTPEGLAVTDHFGEIHLIEFDSRDDSGSAYSQTNGWFILSHLAAVPFEAVSTYDEKEGVRIDPKILLEVGSSDIALRRPANDPNMNGLKIHSLAGGGGFVCHHEGIVEPITHSIFCYLTREGSKAMPWIDSAIEMESIPLLARIDIALRQLLHHADAALSSFAQEALTTKVGPALPQCPGPE